MVIPKVIAAIMSRCNAIASPALTGLTSWDLLRIGPASLARTVYHSLTKGASLRNLALRPPVCERNVNHFKIAPDFFKLGVDFFAENGYYLNCA